MKGAFPMIELKGRSVTVTAAAEVGTTLLDLALKHKADWGFSCLRGACARCRCLVAEGSEHLESPTEEEIERLEPEELDRGYRLGCQAKLAGTGTVRAAFKPYF